jgi:uncharacterized surface protein with fasciclin (FAS1) repeats
MKLVRWIAISFICNVGFGSAYADGHNGFILKALENDRRFSTFTDAVATSGLEQLFSKETKVPKTIYVPTDAAFENLPMEIKNAIHRKEVARKLVRTHYFVGSIENLAEGQEISRVNIEGDLIKIYQAKDLFVKDMVVTKRAFSVGNSEIVPIDCVMFLQPSDTDYRLSAETRNKYPITTCCLRTEAEVNAFLDDLN